MSAQPDIECTLLPVGRGAGARPLFEAEHILNRDGKGADDALVARHVGIAS